MHGNTDGLPPGQVDPLCLQRLFYVDHGCLLAAAAMAVISLFPGIFNPTQKALPANWLDVRTALAAMALSAAISLFLSEESQTLRWHRMGRIFGALTVAMAAATLTRLLDVPTAMNRVPDWNPGSVRQGPLEYSAAAFLLMGIATLLLPSRVRVLGHIADGIAILLSVMVLTPVLEVLFNLAKIGSASPSRLAPPSALWCLALLTPVVVFRRTEHGFLSALSGFGTGSRIARTLAPILLLLPILREIARARLLQAGLIPAQYAEAVLTATGMVVGIILLSLLARYINRMQENIQSLTLRDELTGLHSVRGFYLLAEQAFRYSRRVQEPFGVLFVDMDNLKIINDRLGHSVGSVSLVETAKLLSSAFRETDIIGRVGGDEFVVAGQFKQIELAIAMERLRQAVARKNSAAEQRFSISLSMGYAVTEDFSHDTLRSLVARADEDMYREKRAKKKARAAAAVPSENPKQIADLPQTEGYAPGEAAQQAEAAR